MEEKIVNPETFPVKPEHIDTSSHLWGAFGNYESEVSAHYIVRFCQQIGGWYPFTFDEINNFYKSFFTEPDSDDFEFNYLLTRNNTDTFHHLAIVEKDGKYYVTDRFVLACMSSSPAKFSQDKKGA